MAPAALISRPTVLTARSDLRKRGQGFHKGFHGEVTAAANGLKPRRASCHALVKVPVAEYSLAPAERVCIMGRG